MKHQKRGKKKIEAENKVPRETSKKRQKKIEAENKVPRETSKKRQKKIEAENKVPRETSKKKQNKNRGRKQSSTWNIKKEAKILVKLLKILYIIDDTTLMFVTSQDWKIAA